jgi:hypothetical protein
VLPPAEISYREPGGRARVLLAKLFPTVQVVSRVNTGQQTGAAPGAQGSTFTASVEPPAPSYRVRPALLAGAALLVAALLALIPAGLAWRALRARRLAARRWRPLSPLERALTLIDWTVRRDDADDDRRKALETLAVVLERDAPTLAHSARELAWAEQPPAKEDAGALGSEARSALAGGADARPA